MLSKIINNALAGLSPRQREVVLGDSGLMGRGRRDARCDR